ncbi:hypothetical protein J416_15032 [Gracilibacillus halophilus YIM-C55.5]|uniref:Spore germination protein PB n=1 Tax=Gracilibacillus halophilus YIM-C55.5 TaxID=1308866 RepID=N4W8V4_9BACI|nr:spore germination protein GerPB [Gracilibacillus halophilus]ENH95654.1 hypothetical protein J416_15032 [Gracilibacillus halophilus YIM-C55.5]
MQLTVHQSIYIHTLRVGSITNSSVLQIGSTGKSFAMSQQFNTGGYEQPAEVPTPEEGTVEPPLVPLSPV